MDIILTISQVLAGLKDYVFMGFSYFLGRSHEKTSALKDVLKTTQIENRKYLENVEGITRMSDDAVFNELRKYSRQPDEPSK